MWQYLAKVGITALMVVAISELGKRSPFWGAALASLPLTSLLAFIWMRIDGGGAEQIASLSMGIFWLVVPSLVLFVMLAALLRAGIGFWPALGLSCAATAAAYAGMVPLLTRMGVRDIA